MKHQASAYSVGALALLGAVLWLACSSGGSPGSSGGTFAPSCDALETLSSYRYTYFYEFDTPQRADPVDDSETGDPPFAIPPNAGSFSLGQRFTGEFVSPDRVSIEIDMPSQPNIDSVRMIFIGNQQWINLGGMWVDGSSVNAFPPLSVCEAFLSELDLEGLSFSSDTVNGQETHHFQIERVMIRTIGLLFGPVSDMGRLLTTPSVDVWITPDGWPARLELTSTEEYPSGRELSMEISLEITDPNADDIEVEPPL